MRRKEHRRTYRGGKHSGNAPGESAVIDHMIMSELKRAPTWEISDSEAEHETGPAAAEPDTAYSRTQRALSRPDPPPVPAVRSSSPGDRRRGNRGENREERRMDKDRRREERERQKEEKRQEQRRKKEEKRQEQRRKKEEKRQEQRRKKEAAERVKSLKPEEYLKTVTVSIHPVLLQDPGCDVLLSTLTGLEWRNRIEEHDLTHTISWSRKLPQTEDEEGNVVEEDEVLMVVTQMEFMDMIMSINQALIGGCEEANSLFQLLCEYLNRNTGVVVSLLVTGRQYCQRRGSYDDDEDEASPRSHLGLQIIDIEQVLVYLQLYKNVTVHFLFDWQEVTDHVCAITKALSKRPFRTLQDVPDLGFCVNGLWAGGVHVDRTGQGLAQVWTRQIQQLNHVSVTMATAVTAAYPSPQLLLQAYEKAESEEQQRGLLADLTVRGGSKERRIGPELSNRVHRFMTSKNPELVLD